MEVPEWLLAELLPTRRRVAKLQPEGSRFVAVRVAGAPSARHAAVPAHGMSFCRRRVEQEFPAATLWVVDCDECFAVVKGDLGAA